MDEFSYNASITAGRTQRIMCIIEDDKIYSVDYTGKQFIGYTLNAYDELQNITTEYYNKLVEEGIIEIPKTAEELLKETLDETKQELADSRKINQEMLNLLQQMQDKQTKLLGGITDEPQSTNNNETSDKDISKQRGRAKSSDKSGDSINTGC